MRILLLGEYSNVHHTLALGLRALGHEVLVASDGDGWKGYSRDVDLKRPSLGKVASLGYLLKLVRSFRQFRGYDIVQLINPVFVNLKAERLWTFYKYLRKYNRVVVMGAFGMDYYYVKACLNFHTFRYSDFNMGKVERLSQENEQFKADWLIGSKGELNKKIAKDCDAIVAGLYEYFASYKDESPLSDKLCYIPFPIILQPIKLDVERATDAPVRFFIGIQRKRSVYKGTDIMLRALERIEAAYPGECMVVKAEDMPFQTYVDFMKSSEVILDQLYSYTPAMNALEAMGQGLICVGGGEPENYALLAERSLKPIVNVPPTEDGVYHALECLVKNRNELIPRLRRESREYINRHHDYIKVAGQYETLYRRLLNQVTL